MGDFLDINNNEIDTNLQLHDILTVNADYIESERAEAANIDPHPQSPVNSGEQASNPSCLTTNSDNASALNTTNCENPTSTVFTSSDTPPSGQLPLETLAPPSGQQPLETLVPPGGQSDPEPLLQPVAPQTDHHTGGFIFPSEVDLTIRIIRRDCQ